METYFIYKNKNFKRLYETDSNQHYVFSAEFFSALYYYYSLNGLTQTLRMCLTVFFKNNAINDSFFEANLIRRRIRFPFSRHKLYMRCNRVHVFFLKGYLKNQIIQSNFDVAIVWNGKHFPCSLVAHLCKKFNKKILFCENGFFPNTYQVDFNGSNYDNSVTRNAKYYYEHYKELSPLPLPSTLIIRHSKKRPEKSLVLPENYAFVPFQVPSDTQILYNSPWIHSMEDLYDVIYKIAERIPEQVFVIKEHPSYRFSIKKKLKNHSRILFANDNPTKQLITYSDYVITINSTVGIESLLLKKPVITLGNACYNIDGMIHNCLNLEALLTVIKQKVYLKVDSILADLFLKYLFNYYLFHGEITLKNLAAFMKKPKEGFVVGSVESRIPHVKILK